MKKLYLHIFLLLLPLLLLILFIPIDKRMRFQNMENDCFNHGIWIYDRIFNNSTPIDIAFFGSSHTINAVNDILIEENKNGLHVVNLGYCRLGMNLNFVLIKNLLEAKRVKQIILEVREDEDRYSHPVFPQLADEEDVFLSCPFYNRNILSDDYTALVFKIQLLQQKLFQQKINSEIRTDTFGYAGTDIVADEKDLDSAIQKRTNAIPLSEFERNFFMQFPRAYLKMIHQLCQENQVQLKFLYLPAYGTTPTKPKENNTYSQYGEVLIPPDSIFLNKNNWQDKDHLNEKGANEISEWLSQNIN